MSKVAIIAGGGVAGLTAAKELLEHTDVKPIIFEMTDMLGGISKTVNYKGNLMDIGGHRFFSKSDRVMHWWMETLEETEMLERTRVSRIFYLKKFFEYPISLNMKTLKQLGFAKVIKLGFSYTKAMMFPIKPEENLEDFFINRFGKELYITFFRDYTEKVWGVPCSQIQPEWGSQRIKGISIKEVIIHAIKSKIKKSDDLAQKDIETSLINRFLYPKYGVGQMWEKTGEHILKKGAEIHYNHRVIGFDVDENMFKSVTVLDLQTHETKKISCDYFFSTMPIREVIGCMEVPKNVGDIASELMYRDFISVGVLCKKFNLGNDSNQDDYRIPDNWIYIQENSVKMGRIQIFNNWSPYMVKDSDHMWVGLEYFCNEGDDFWKMSDEQIRAFAIEELIKIEAVSKQDVIDSTVVRMPKAYPSYFGGYEHFDEVKHYLDGFENLFLIGRNGMHRYNNMDHSMLSAMEAVQNIKKGIVTKENIWAVNTETEYHEEK